MACKTLFQSFRGALFGKVDAINEAGGTAYRFDDRHALAQYAATGCLRGTYYASAETQLKTVLELCARLDPEFIAKTALYAREQGMMKDLPALLCAVLSVKGSSQLVQIFDRVIDTPKMLRNFVQILRSGVVGRKSLGSLPKRLVAQWLTGRTDEQLFRGCVGNDPSLADVIKMTHPKPQTPSREALYGYLLGRIYDAEKLPPLVRRYEAYKTTEDRLMLETPDVPFQLLTALELKTWEWKNIARHATWQTTRMNLNTFVRHGVFDDREIVRIVAARLRNPELIKLARAFPYQLMMAYYAASDVPEVIRTALQDAMEVATANVPRVTGQVYIFPDVSGSMHSPITGYRKGATSAVRCVDVAALIAAAMLRNCPQATVIPFEHDACLKVKLNPRDTVLTNAKRLAAVGGGGTNCSAPLAHLNKVGATGDLIIYVSDNESWVDSMNGPGRSGSTATMREWAALKHRNPQARMICIDLQPNKTTQTQERDDVVNVGGFSDEVFRLIGAMAANDSYPRHWADQIDQVPL